MNKIIVWLYILLTLVLAAATIAEEFLGTSFVKQYIYGSPWFVLLWAPLLVFVLILFVRKGVGKRPFVFLLHFALLIIFLGGMLTWLTGKRGYIYLQQGRVENFFISEDDEAIYPLPFTISLDTFMIDYYPGTSAPLDYSSYVTIESDGQSWQEIVSMNNVLSIKGFRFYQNSYDSDSDVSWLMVNNDPYGSVLVYSGFFLLMLAFTGSLFSRKEKFRTLLRHPVFQKGGVLVLLTFLFMGLDARNVDNNITRTPVLAREVADSMKRIQVLHNDRVVPFNTLATDIVRKITGKDNFLGLTAEQVVGSIIAFPDEWNNVELINIGNNRLSGILGVDSRYAKVTDLFDDGKYRLNELDEGGIPAKRGDSFDKALSLTNEKVAIILMLEQGTFVDYLQIDDDAVRLTESKVDAELLYNSIPFTKLLFMFNLTIGFLTFIWLLYCALKNMTPHKWKSTMLNGILLLSFLFHSLGFGLRWYIGGRFPVGNGYETMQFMAWSILILSLVFSNRVRIIVPAGFLLSGFFLLVAYLGQSTPQITPLIPVLISPWLSLHVSIIMISYALFAFMLFTGITAIIIDNSNSSGKVVYVEKLTVINRIFLYPAVFLLGTGICLGAIWANQSWGRYWGWDPKEVWALITLLIYGFAFHREIFSSMRRPIFFHWYLVLAFAAVIMTYFGVNAFLGGVHSY